MAYRHLGFVLLLCASLPAVEFLGVDYSQTDKQQHVIAGAAASAIALVIVDRIDPAAPWYVRAGAGVLAAAAVGAGKEWYDSRHRDSHTTDINDFTATTMGGAVVAFSLCWSF